MEKNLENVLCDILNTCDVTGCIVSDKQGLCLGSKGVVGPESSGLLTAISEYAGKLHPNETAPVIVLETNEKQCVIQSNEKLVVSLHRNLN